MGRRRRMKTFGANDERNGEEGYRKRNETKRDETKRNEAKQSGRPKRKRAPKNRGTEIERGNANTVFFPPRTLSQTAQPEF